METPQGLSHIENHSLVPRGGFQNIGVSRHLTPGNPHVLETPTGYENGSLCMETPMVFPHIETPYSYTPKAVWDAPILPVEVATEIVSAIAVVFVVVIL